MLKTSGMKSHHISNFQIIQGGKVWVYVYIHVHGDEAAVAKLSNLVEGYIGVYCTVLSSFSLSAFLQHIKLRRKWRQNNNTLQKAI